MRNKYIFITLIIVLISIFSCGKEENSHAELIARLDKLAAKTTSIDITIKKDEEIQKLSLDSLDIEVDSISKKLVDIEAQLTNEEKVALQEQFETIKNKYKLY